MSSTSKITLSMGLSGLSILSNSNIMDFFAISSIGCSMELKEGMEYRLDILLSNPMIESSHGIRISSLCAFRINDRAELSLIAITAVGLFFNVFQWANVCPANSSISSNPPFLTVSNCMYSGMIPIRILLPLPGTP